MDQSSAPSYACICSITWQSNAEDTVILLQTMQCRSCNVNVSVFVMWITFLMSFIVVLDALKTYNKWKNYVNLNVLSFGKLNVRLTDYNRILFKIVGISLEQKIYKIFQVTIKHQGFSTSKLVEKSNSHFFCSVLL